MFSLDLNGVEDPDSCSREMCVVHVQTVDGGTFQGDGTVCTFLPELQQALVPLPRDSQAAAMGSGHGFCEA